MNAPAPPTEYTAPEVWKAMTLARTCLTTAAADVWAVGALAFELSTGALLSSSTCSAAGVLIPRAVFPSTEDTKYEP